mgnify:CR=1 FL=1
MTAESPGRVHIREPGQEALQWSRGRMTAESGTEDPAGGVADVASMEPRSDDRGEIGRTMRQEVHGNASMEPRSDDRGEPERLPQRSPLPQCFNGAAVG